MRKTRTTFSAFGRVCCFRTSLVLVLTMSLCRFALCSEIHEAVKNNDAQKVRDLIGSNPDLVLSKDGDGFTPLHLAAANGYKGIVEFLLTTKADANARDNAGSTPLHQAAAAKGDHSDLVELLITHDADVNAADSRGLTPLHYATLGDNKHAVESLLKHGANANAKDHEIGDTSLILAAASGSKEIAKLLLANGADVNQPDNKGTPLAWAEHTGHGEIANLLRKHGGHE